MWLRWLALTIQALRSQFGHSRRSSIDFATVTRHRGNCSVMFGEETIERFRHTSYATA
jgi:hypothetical protein